jgi:hypothetical protein
MWYQQERVACMRIWVRDVLPKLDYALFWFLVVLTDCKLCFA